MNRMSVEIKITLLEAYVDFNHDRESIIGHVHDIFGPQNCPDDEVMMDFLDRAADFVDYFSDDNLDLSDSDSDGNGSTSSIEQIVREPALNIDVVELHSLQYYLQANPRASLSQAKSNLEIKNWTSVVKEYLQRLHRYFVRTFNSSLEEEAIARVKLADNVLQAIDSGKMDIENIIFADIVHVTLDKHVYKDNFRFFGEELPHFSRLRAHHDVDLIMYAAMSFDFLKIAFIEEPEDGSSLVDLIKEQFGDDKLGDKKDRMWYIQDGTDDYELTSPAFHSALAEIFDNRVIGIKNSNFYAGGIEYPPNTCFLSPCDFFLWGWIASKVYNLHCRGASDFKSGIRFTISLITPEMRQLAIQTAIRRLEFVKMTNGTKSINVYI